MATIYDDKNKKKRKLRINLDVILFGCLFIYIICYGFIYISKERVSYYEVTPGEMVETDRFKSLVLCEDQVVPSGEDGIIYYLVKSGTKVGVQTPIFCLDNNNSIKQIIDNNSSTILDTTDLNGYYSELYNFSDNYSDNDFSYVYQFKSNTDTIILNALSESLVSEDSGNGLKMSRSTQPGYVYYFIDGYEGTTDKSITSDMFDFDNYSCKRLNNDTSIGTDDIAYKLVTSEDWSIVVKLKDYQYDKYIDDEYIEVRFLKDNQNLWGQINTYDIDNEKYCQIKFTNSIVRYADSRYTDVEVIFSSETGLKVPNSSIVVKQFYVIPKEYAEASNDTITVSILTQDKENKPILNKKELDVYQEDADYYLVSIDDIDENSVIIEKESGNTFTVIDTVPVNGVYNINRGYARFNEVTILTQNDDFSIIKPNDKYGLIEYDHIVLNGNDVVDEEIVKQQ